MIPCLLLYEGGLVKTRRFSKPKYVGDPINAIRIFNEKEVDELIVLDIAASKRGERPNYGLIEQFAGECFMPLCYGGGVRSVADAQRLVSLGVEKVCIQTAALDDTTLISQMADSLGSQSVVASLDVKRSWRNKPLLYRSAVGRPDSRPWLEYLRSSVASGAGEVVLNAVDRDGTMGGMDTGLIAEACAAISVPLIAVGGVGNLQHIKAAVDAGASGVGAGAFFVFHGPHRAVLITYPRRRDLEAVLTESE